MKNKNTDMKNRFADRGKSHAGYFLRFVFCLVLTAAASLAQAQNRNQVSGKVTDKAGEPLIGATVVVVGTTTGATTGADGRFTIGVPAGGELKISYIGYVEQTVKVGAQSVLDIVLEEDSQMLKDVVVIGYGTMEKKSVTSSISSIKGDDLVAGMGGSTIATALQGKIPGLTISGSASPNSSNDFQLRGVASVNASKGPLVIIDGIPGGDMRALNQEDIESVDVLKDASAGAIYGTRAAEAAGLSPDVLRMEIDRARKRLLRQEKREETRREMDPAAAVQPFQRELRYDNVRSAVAEEGLLRMLFREPALLAQTEGLTAEDFSVPLFGRVYAALRERWQNDLAITHAALADSLSPAEMAHLTAVLQKQEPPLSETALADYLRILREERAKARVSDASDLLAMQRDLKKKKGYGGS